MRCAAGEQSQRVGLTSSSKMVGLQVVHSRRAAQQADLHMPLQETSYGLNRLINAFLDSAVSLARDNFVAQNLDAPTWQFMWV